MTWFLYRLFIACSWAHVVSEDYFLKITIRHYVVVVMIQTVKLVLTRLKV